MLFSLDGLKKRSTFRTVLCVIARFIMSSYFFYFYVSGRVIDEPLCFYINYWLTIRVNCDHKEHVKSMLRWVSSQKPKLSAVYSLDIRLLYLPLYISTGNQPISSPTAIYCIVLRLFHYLLAIYCLSFIYLLFSASNHLFSGVPVVPPPSTYYFCRFSLYITEYLG